MKTLLISIVSTLFLFNLYCAIDDVKATEVKEYGHVAHNLQDYNGSLSELPLLHPRLYEFLADISLEFDITLTDISRTPQDYRNWGMTPYSQSNHYVQADGYSHAFDIQSKAQYLLDEIIEVKDIECSIHGKSRGTGNGGDHLHCNIKEEVEYSREVAPDYVNMENKTIPIACWNSKTQKVVPITAKGNCYLLGGGGHNVLSLPISQWEAWWDATGGNIGIITNSISTANFESMFNGNACRLDSAGNCADYGYMQISFIHNCKLWATKTDKFVEQGYFVYGNKVCVEWGDWDKWEAWTLDIYQSIKWYLVRRDSLKRRLCYNGTENQVVSCLAKHHNGNPDIPTYGNKAMRTAVFYRSLL